MEYHIKIAKEMYNWCNWYNINWVLNNYKNGPIFKNIIIQEKYNN